MSDISKDLAHLFARSWSATTLADCPLLREWAICLGKETKLSPWIEQIVYRVEQSMNGTHGVPTINPLQAVLMDEQFHIQWSAVAGTQAYELQEAVAASVSEMPNDSAFATVYNKIK